METDRTKKAGQGEREKSAAAHTYDKGYARWEQFDVDTALASTLPTRLHTVRRSTALDLSYDLG